MTVLGILKSSSRTHRYVIDRLEWPKLMWLCCLPIELFERFDIRPKLVNFVIIFMRQLINLLCRLISICTFYSKRHDEAYPLGMMMPYPYENDG